LCTVLNAQSLEIERTGKPIIKSGQDTTDLTKPKGYIKALEWLATVFNDSKSVIQVQDKEEGFIMGKGNFQTVLHPGGIVPNQPTTVYFTVKVWIYDSSYKYEFSNFNAEGYGSITDGEAKYVGKMWGKKMADKMLQKMWPELRDATKNKSDLLTLSLKSFFTQ
ncbi:MAG TPA: DUF4468 domain-containing protein, partial [Niabella sp.]